MELAIVAAEYTPDEADKLRRAMAARKRHGSLEPHRVRLTERMLAKGYQPDFIARIFEQIKGFGSYGFPESHAASFALLTYASCWLKRHEPAAFACALINSWPMGFYNPDQILQTPVATGWKSARWTFATAAGIAASSQPPGTAGHPPGATHGARLSGSRCPAHRSRTPTPAIHRYP